MWLLMALGRRLLVLALVLAIPVIAAELLARKLVGDAVASAVHARIGGSPHIDLGSTPLLWQIAHGRLDRVGVRAGGARIGGLPPLALTGTLTDVHLTKLTSLQGAIGSLRLTARLDPAEVREMLATPACVGSLPASIADSLTPRPRVAIFPGRIDLLPPAGRAAEVRLRPAATPARVSFALIGVDRDGVPVATTAAVTGCTERLSGLPFGVSLRSATASRGALDLSFAGRDASFSAIG